MNFDFFLIDVYFLTSFYNISTVNKIGVKSVFLAIFGPDEAS